MRASGSKIWVERRSVGGVQRVGEIVEVLGEPGHVRYCVRWEDGRETIVYPGSDATLSMPEPQAEPGERARREATPKAKSRARPDTGRAGASMIAVPGDRLVIRAHRLGEPEQDAEILEVLGPEGRPPYRVRWEETGEESLFFPGSDAFVEHLAQRGGRAKRPSAKRGKSQSSKPS